MFLQKTGTHSRSSAEEWTVVNMRLLGCVMFNTVVWLSRVQCWPDTNVESFSILAEHFILVTHWTYLRCHVECKSGRFAANRLSPWCSLYLLEVDGGHLVTLNKHREKHLTVRSVVSNAGPISTALATKQCALPILCSNTRSFLSSLIVFSANSSAHSWRFVSVIGESHQFNTVLPHS